ESDGLSGLITEEGYLITKPIYKYIFPSSEGIFRVSQEGSFDTGYIDSNGTLITGLVYGSSSTDFSEGFAKVQTNKCIKTDFGEYCLTGFINHSGIFTIPSIFHEAGDFSEGTTNVAIVEKFPKPHILWGIINKSGTFVIKLSSDRYYRNFSSGLAAFSDNKTGLYGYININGETIAKPIYDFAFDFTGHHALVEKNKEYAVIKNDGSYIFPFDGYTASGPDFEGTIRISNKVNTITIYRNGKIEYNNFIDIFVTYLRRIYIIFFIGLKPI
ncbi:WG repeat-containing protein, partial [Leptospira kanakyensis]